MTLISTHPVMTNAGFSTIIKAFEIITWPGEQYQIPIEGTKFK